MSYSQVRGYLKNEIESFNPKYKEWRDALVFDDAQNVPSTLADTRYHIEMNSMTSTPAQDTLVQDSWLVTMTLLKYGFNDPLSALDSLLDDAFCIKSVIIDCRNVEEYKQANDGSIEAVELLSINPSAIDASNDNVVKVQMQFNVRMYYSTLTN